MVSSAVSFPVTETYGMGRFQMCIQDAAISCKMRQRAILMLASGARESVAFWLLHNHLRALAETDHPGVQTTAWSAGRAAEHGIALRILNTAAYTY